MMYLKKFQKSRLNNIRLLYGDVQQHFMIVIIPVGFVMCGRIYDKNYIVIHGREEYKIRSTFKDFIKKIKKNDFITISYGILVNMRYVQYINLKEMMVVLENEIQLPLSYKYKNSVKEAYQEYKIR